MKITVVGLGPGPYALLTREAADLLERAPKVWLRTSRHPTVQQLPPTVKWESLDYVYDRCESFEKLYQELAQELLAIAQREGDTIYAVPGDPSMAEDSVREILRLAQEQNIELQLMPGVSFLEVSLAAARTTLSGGLQLFDAAHVASANPLVDLLVYQIEDRLVASDVKLELLRRFPDDHPVKLITAAGTPGRQSVRTVHLHDLDRQQEVDHLTALYVPASTPDRALGSFDSFARIVARLRAPDGCPWDRQQTHESLKPYVVEEAYEVVEAIDKGDPATLSEELGDLLLQVLLHAQIADEAGDFDITDVVGAIAAKMVRRHPHVFGEVSVSGAQEVLVNWEAIKKTERGKKEEGESMFAGIPKHMPALQAAQELQGRAARVGFDWKDIQPVLDKVSEEVEELSRAQNATERQAELGDILFALVNVARHLGVNAEMALRSANRKFVERFTRMEELAREQGADFASLPLEQQDELWNQAKAEESDE
ncbi:MAG: bifunctional methyltransferase/pyrophosphohydrolase YabN [Chloroflexota bacterium]